MIACNDDGVPASRWVFLVPPFYHYIGRTILHTQFVFVKVCDTGRDRPVLFFVTERDILLVTLRFLIPFEFGTLNHCDVFSPLFIGSLVKNTNAFSFMSSSLLIFVGRREASRWHLLETSLQISLVAFCFL